MPTNGWDGLTADDDSQAQAIATVMKTFTDEGIEVWLRFGASPLLSRLESVLTRRNAQLTKSSSFDLLFIHNLPLVRRADLASLPRSYYQTDGTYTGDSSDFKAGWAAVAAAVADNDLVKMFVRLFLTSRSLALRASVNLPSLQFTPNVADLDTYKEFFPDDTSTGKFPSLLFACHKLLLTSNFSLCSRLHRNREASSFTRLFPVVFC